MSNGLKAGLDFAVEEADIMRAARMAAPAGALLVALPPSGCAGRQLAIKTALPPSADDPAWVLAQEAEGLQVWAKASDAQWLEGARLAWEPAFGGGRWGLRTPRISATCGCGVSMEFEPLALSPKTLAPSLASGV